MITYAPDRIHQRNVSLNDSLHAFLAKFTNGFTPVTQSGRNYWNDRQRGVKHALQVECPEGRSRSGGGQPPITATDIDLHPVPRIVAVLLRVGQQFACTVIYPALLRVGAVGAN